MYDTWLQTKRLVGRATGSSGAKAARTTGLVSGDGRSVVFLSTDVQGQGAGIFRRDLLSHVTTKIGERPADLTTDGNIEPQITSVSDDGRIVAVTFFDGTRVPPSVIVTPQRRIDVPGWARVSPDGRTGASLTTDYEPGTTELLLIDTETGTRTARPGPANALSDGPFGFSYPGVSWISPDGGLIAVSPSAAGPPTFGSGKSFETVLWSRSQERYESAGPYAGSLAGSGPGSPFFRSAVSRSGRFAVLAPVETDIAFRYGSKGLVIADNWQRGLPGGADLPPATFYAYEQGTSCGEDGRTRQSFQAHVAPTYLPKAASVRGVVKAGGETVLDATVTSDETGRASIRAGARTSSLTVTVTFEDGRTTTETYDFEIDAARAC